MFSKLNPLRRGPEKTRAEEKLRNIELPKSYQSLVASQLAKEADDLNKVLEAHDLKKTAFQVGDAPYLFAHAVSGEHVVQSYYTNDPCLKDVLVDGKSIKDERPAWFAITTHRLGVGRVSRNWKDQMAIKSHTYEQLTGIRCQTENKLRIEASDGIIEVVFDPQVKEEVSAAFKAFIERKRAKKAA